MHTPSIIKDSYTAYLNMYMDDRLFLASSGVMQLKASRVETIRTYDILRNIARLQPIYFFLKIGLFIFPICTSSRG